MEESEAHRIRVQTAAERVVGLAVVGLGYWGPNLVRAVAELEGAEVVALCDRNGDRLAQQARRYPYTAVTQELDDVLEDDRIDAVLLATPIATHHALARRCLEAGKHVFVEKPLASTVAECQDLLAFAEEHELVLMPGHTFLYSPPVVKIKELLHTGELGDLYFLTSTRVNLGIYQSDSSVIRDLAPHDFSILHYWLGMPSVIRAIGRDSIVPGTTDVAFIDLAYPSGTLARVELSWLAPTKLRRTVLAGRRKMVVYDDTSREQVRVYDHGVDLVEPQSYGEHQLAYRLGDVLSPRLDVDEPLRLELDDFVVAVTSGGLPRSSAAIGLDVVRMVAATEESLRRSGDAVTLKGDDEPPTRPHKMSAPRVWDAPARLLEPPGEQPIPLFSPARAFAALRDEACAVFERVARAGAFTLGDELEAFEAEFGEFCGARHAVGVADGTSAIRLALLALGVGEGDEVVTVPHTFVATVEAIASTGARPVLVDVDPVTRSMDPWALAAAITSRTVAVVPVHLYGRPAPVDEICKLARRSGLRILEDAAQAHGASLGGVRTGALADAAAFSFYPTKNLGAFGDGGAVTCRDEDVADAVMSMRHHGSAPGDANNHVRRGATSRLDNLQAALLRLKLRRLDGDNAERRSAAEAYDERLAGLPLTLPPAAPDGGTQVHHLYVVEVDERDRVLAELRAAGVGAGVHYPTPVHLQPAWRGLGYARGDFPVAERLAGRVLSLPLFPGIEEPEVERVATALRRALRVA
jgi:dTDP-4-amino-4,6-dideoxygalactose transaminase/predicted dehydrogenase